MLNICFIKKYKLRKRGWGGKVAIQYQLITNHFDSNIAPVAHPYQLFLTIEYRQNALFFVSFI